MKATIELSDRKRARHFPIHSVRDVDKCIRETVGNRLLFIGEYSRAENDEWREYKIGVVVDGATYKPTGTPFKKITAFVTIEHEKADDE